MRISVIRYRGAAPAQPIAFDFDRQGGSIGRDAANELPLPDPERHVSRVQARVDFDGQGYGLFDLGRNPTLVDGRALIKGDRLSLAGGEVLTMGSYELRVEPPAPARSGEAGMVTATAMRASDDPFAVFAAVQAGPRPEPAVAADPFARPAPEPGPCWRDELGLGPPPLGTASIDELFGLQAGRDDLFAGTPLAPPVQPSLPPLDPLPAGVQPLVVQAHASVQRDDAPMLGQAFKPPQPIRAACAIEALASGPCVEPTGGIPRQAASQSGPDAEPLGQAGSMPCASRDELLEAFLRGLGVSLELSAGLTPALLEQVGVMLREATQGTLDLLKARAITRREVRAEATLIASRHNNPLKFSPDIDFALAQLLTSRSKGFMGAGEAMRDAYDDLCAHQIGMVAGMRSALAGVLARFDPVELEARVASRRLLDRLRPSGRKARLWELFGRHYAELAREASDDFNALFGKAFLEAYEQQIGRLQRQDHEVQARPARKA